MTQPFATRARIGAHIPPAPGFERNVSRDDLRLQVRLLDAVEQAGMATDLDGIVISRNRFAER